MVMERFSLAGLLRAARHHIFRRIGLIIILGGMLFQQTSNFIIGVFVGHALGSYGYGLVNIIRNIFSISLILTPLGLDLAILKYGPRFTSRTTFLLQMRRFRTLVAIVNLLLVLLAVGAFGGYLEKYVYRYAGFSTYLLIALLGLPLASDVAVLGAVYKVEGRPARFALMTAWLQTSVRLIGGFLTLALHWPVVSVLITNTLAYALSLLAAWGGRLLGRHQDDDIRGALEDTGDLQTWGYTGMILGDSLWMALSLFAYGVLRFVDVLVLGVYAPAQVVGSYAALSTISQIVATYPLATSQTLGPQISHSYYNGDMNEVKNALNNYISKASIIGSFAFGGIAAWGSHLDLVFGSSFSFDGNLAILLPLGWLISATLAPTGYSLSMTGHHRAELLILGAGALVLIAGCLLLVPRYGGLGAAIGVLTAFLAIDLTRFAAVMRYLGFRLGRAKDLLPPFLALALAFAIRAFMDAALGRTLLVMFAGCAGYAMAYAGLFYGAHHRRNQDVRNWA